MKKMHNNLIAGRICAGVLSLALTVGLLSPGLTALAAKDSAVLPDWVPGSFEDALAFRNTHGAVNIESGFLCVQYVVGRQDGESYDYDPKRFEPLATEGVMKEVARFTFADTDSAAKKEETGSEKPGLVFETIVYQPVSAGKFEAALADRWAKGGDSDGESSFNDGYTHTVANYFFTVDEDMNITETDIYSWLPDCYREYEQYVEENGQASAHGEYMVICISQASGIAYTWKGKDTNPEWARHSDCSVVYAQPVGGGRMADIFLYRAKEDGPVEIAWELVTVFGDAEPMETVEGNYIAFDGGETILAPGFTYVKLVDAETGSLIDIDALGEYPAITTDVGYYDEKFKEDGGDGWIYTGPVYLLESNPTILGKQFTSFFHADKFSFHFSAFVPWISEIEEKRQVTEYENGSYGVVMLVQQDVQGDLNRDGVLGIADLVLLQRWLTGDAFVFVPVIVIDDPIAVPERAAVSPYVNDRRWRYGDYNMDGKLDVRDMTLMKQALLRKGIAVR
ncbi:MAG: dockerin type I repeat-containing protein [Oscillospiraceae bacterium]|nr:dockerin type I repeat-containing protein [Oscillospiraceae bacterium]